MSLTLGAGGSVAEEAGLCFEPRFILEAVARRMNVTLRPEVPVPAILLESQTPLPRFQRAVGAQWRFLPRGFSNTYVIARNEIYLLDDVAFYAKHGRTLDDALAHEFVHYLQAKYLHEDLTSEWREAEAVAVQTWFREEYGSCRTSGSRGEPPTQAPEASRSLPLRH